MKRNLWTGTTFVLLAIGILVAVLSYNTWSYCCGRCTLGTFLTLGPYEVLLLGVALIAALILAVLRHRNRRPGGSGRCPCGASLVPEWTYCPACGIQRSSR